MFPQAVGRNTDAVPDIYKMAPAKDGWVHLAADLKVGDRVKLIGDNRADVHEVLEVADGRFRTAFKTDGDRVFVYGREVNDFRSVDYDAIAMLNVSATQELHRRQEAQTARIAELEQQRATQSARIAEQVAELADLKGQVAEIAALKRQVAEIARLQAASTAAPRSEPARFATGR